MSDRKDKKLYSYKQALSQPYWIQRFNDEFSLKSPIKFSRVVYGALVFALFWMLLARLMSFAPFGLRGVVSLAIAWYLSMLLSDLVVDGKPLVFYLKDYLLFYFKYGIVADHIFINKGQVYKKPLNFKKERKEEY